MAATLIRWIVALTLLAIVLAAGRPSVTPQSTPLPPPDDTRPISTHDPALGDPWLHVRGTPTPVADEHNDVHDR